MVIIWIQSAIIRHTILTASLKWRPAGIKRQVISGLDGSFAIKLIDFLQEAN